MLRTAKSTLKRTKRTLGGSTDLLFCLLVRSLWPAEAGRNSTGTDLHVTTFVRKIKKQSVKDNLLKLIY